MGTRNLTSVEFNPVSGSENLVWTIHITSMSDDLFYFYADGKLIARIDDCEDSMDAIKKFGEMVYQGDVEFTEDLRSKP